MQLYNSSLKYGRLQRSQCRLIKYVWRMIVVVNWSRSKCTTTLEQTILGKLYIQVGRYTVGLACIAVGSDHQRKETTLLTRCRQGIMNSSLGITRMLLSVMTLNLKYVDCK